MKHQKIDSFSVDNKGNIKFRNASRMSNKSRSQLSCPKSPISPKSPGLKKRTKSSHRNHSRNSDIDSINKREKSPKLKTIDEVLESKKEIQKLTSVVEDLKDENIELKNKLKEKDEIIEDITEKIRLLEDAIEEHEQNMTARDGVLEEYQRKEKQYQIHIDELQKSIEALIKGKQKNSEITIIYEDLKMNFEKEREYYLDKVNDYEQRVQSLSQENLKLKSKISCSLNCEEEIKEK